MTLSDKDRNFINEVAEYYRKTVAEGESEGSIRATAQNFNLSRTKVRKILVTSGDLRSELTERATELRKDGKSIKEIASALGVSVATASVALPYEDKFDGSLDPSSHASDVRNYRSNERRIASIQVRSGAGANKYDNHNISNRSSDMNLSKGTNNAVGTGQNFGADIAGTNANLPAGSGFHDGNAGLNANGISETIADEKKKVIADLEEKISSKEDYLFYHHLGKEAHLEIRRLKNSLYFGTGYECGRTDFRKDLITNKYFQGDLGSRTFDELALTTSNESKGVISADRKSLQVMRLHLELCTEGMGEEKLSRLLKLADVKYGKSISRDIVVPACIPLFALNYVVQRLFGWQNSHLHKFYLDDKVNEAITDGRIDNWSNLVGVVYRSPDMNENEKFWCDDYKSGSFLSWLRSKYTGPYVSLSSGELYDNCQYDMCEYESWLNSDVYVCYQKDGGGERITRIVSVESAERDPQVRKDVSSSSRYEIRKLKDMPLSVVKHCYNLNIDHELLERLPVNSILVPQDYAEMSRYEEPEPEKIAPQFDQIMESFENALDDDENPFADLQNLDSKTLEKIAIADSINSELYLQGFINPFADELYYAYDFGDGWKIKITASHDCPDLVEAGRVSQLELDRANYKCRITYRPVLLAADGIMVMDDVGGIWGLLDFLEKIHPDYSSMNDVQRKDAIMERENSLDWAKKYSNWHEHPTLENINFL
ncbi:MAG: hypothetical protein IJ523_06210 [Succinivibrionaceae bacterium]|nr:hypothetical protein [Succinivibrionaceae bacterium]